jgi:hypothetical protein
VPGMTAENHEEPHVGVESVPAEIRMHEIRYLYTNLLDTLAHKYRYPRQERLWGSPSLLPIQWVSGALSLGVKWPGRETDHSPPSSADVK